MAPSPFSGWVSPYIIYVTHYTLSHTDSTLVFTLGAKLCLIVSTDGQFANSLFWKRLKTLKLKLN